MHDRARSLPAFLQLSLQLEGTARVPGHDQIRLAHPAGNCTLRLPKAIGHVRLRQVIAARSAAAELRLRDRSQL
jgi:hypothetical protein